MAHPDPDSAPLAIRLFGPFDVRIAGEPMPRLRSRKGQWLLALLTLRPGREVDRSWIAGTLWPESAEGDALYSLRRSLADLRAALGPEGERLVSSGPRTLRLDLTGAFADLPLFDAASGREDTTSLKEAVALYGGPLLEGCTEEWLLPERAAREGAFLRAAERLAKAAREAGDDAEAVRYFRLAVAQDPFNEPAVRGLLEALAAAGDYAGVGRAYEDLRRLLRRELDAEPAGDTQALARRIQEEAGSVVTAARPRRSPIGAVTGAVPRPQPLPRPVSTLVGREAEVRAIRDCLQRSRLVTLLGPAGIGKTRVALAAAAGLQREGASCAYVDFSALADEELVPAVAALALGLGETPGLEVLQTLTEALQEQRLLLILDNCEHLLAACAALARAVLEGCASVRILATSREPLRLAGEIAWPVPALALPVSASHAPEALEQFEGVRLFMERARETLPSFTLTSANAEAVLSICRRLDGMPLAIELAASRMRALAPEQIAARLDDRFTLLIGSSAVPSRQQTLRAALDWSYELLDEEERALFRRLSVFSGGCSLEAVEVVSSQWSVVSSRSAAGDEALGTRQSRIQNPKSKIEDLMGRLIDRSLAVRDEGGEARYRMLESVLEYGRERLLEAGEEGQARQRHAYYFLRAAEEERSSLGEWLERMEREQENLRAALTWLRGSGETVPALRLAGLLWPFWDLRGHWSEGREHLDALLESDGGEDSPERAEALIGAGNLARRQGDCAAAAAFHSRALECARANADSAAESRALHEQGLSALLQGDYETAAARYEESLDVEKARGDCRRIAALTNDLGEAARLLGDYRAARARFEECLAEAQERGDERAEAGALANLGNLAAEQENYPRARRLGERSLALLRRLGDRRGEALVLNNLGLAALGMGDLAAAGPLLRRALLVRRELEDRWGLAHSLEALATLAIRGGQWERAAYLFGAAEALRERGGFAMDPADRRHYERDLAALHAELGEEGSEDAWSEGRMMRLEEVLELADGLEGLVR